MRFDLEKALAAWRHPFKYQRSFLKEDLDELERHIRDAVAELVAEGMSEEAAFREAVQELGDFGGAEDEYRKVYWGKVKRKNERLREVSWRLVMLTNYLKVAVRNLRKHKGYAAINVMGLAVGLACCLLLMLFVQDELRYDRFHEKADRIYRVKLDAKLGDQELMGPLSPAPMAATFLQEYPEVEQVTRLHTSLFGIMPEQARVEYDAHSFMEGGFYFADSTFFDVFSFPLTQGDPATALRDPNTVVISASMAQKYFGSDNPVGKVLIVEGADYEITGVMEDIPVHSHVHFDFLGSLESLGISRREQWIGNMFYTYLVLKEGHSVAAFEAKLAETTRKYAGPNFQDMLGVDFDQFLASGGRYNYSVQPLTDIHLYSHMENELEANGDMGYVIAFSVIAALILLIACINFMNLATARSANRAKEVGVRKVLGSGRSQLTLQFLAESTLLSGVALFVGLLLVEAMLPVFNHFSGKSLSVPYMAGFFLPGLLVLVGGVGIIAGSYPAFFLSSFRIINVLKGKLRSDTKNAGLRGGLVVFQFAISIALIIGTAVVYQQVDYVQTKHLGFDKEHVVVIDRADALDTQRDAFKQEILQLPGVVAASVTNNLPGSEIGDDGFYVEGGSSDETELTWMMYADHDFVSTLGIDVVEGRDFSRDRPADSLGLLLNQAAVEAMGLEDPVGTRLVSAFRGDDAPVFTVIGVIDNFHFQSLHDEIRPLAIEIGGWTDLLAVRIRPDDVSGTLRALEEQWQAFVPEQAMSFSFLDNSLDEMYRADQRSGQIFGIFSGLAILIACLGLFGLAAFMAEQRTKEVGVRKVLGASIGSVVLLLSKDFLKLVGVAFVIAAPLAYFAMSQWLDNFAYRIDIGVGTLLLSGLIALSIALLTVSYQSIKAATGDPVKALRYE